MENTPRLVSYLNTFLCCWVVVSKLQKLYRHTRIVVLKAGTSLHRWKRVLACRRRDVFHLASSLRLEWMFRLPIVDNGRCACQWVLFRFLKTSSRHFLFFSWIFLFMGLFFTKIKERGIIRHKMIRPESTKSNRPISQAFKSLTIRYFFR